MTKGDATRSSRGRGDHDQFLTFGQQFPLSVFRLENTLLLTSHFVNFSRIILT